LWVEYDCELIGAESAGIYKLLAAPTSFENLHCMRVVSGNTATKNLPFGNFGTEIFGSYDGTNKIERRYGSAAAREYAPFAYTSSAAGVSVFTCKKSGRYQVSWHGKANDVVFTAKAAFALATTGTVVEPPLYVYPSDSGQGGMSVVAVFDVVSGQTFTLTTTNTCTTFDVSILDVIAVPTNYPNGVTDSST
jgi:hypothetical protein